MMLAKDCTVHDALRYGAERLALRDDLRAYAARDAQQILEIATGLSRVQMLAQPERRLSAEQVASYQGMLAQRRGAVPVQHLRGSQEFYGREFFVTPDVLIPRPETEHLVEEVLRLYTDRTAAIRMADVGTGSGVLAITLALAYPQAWVCALDISDAALGVARANAAALGCAERVRCVESDLMAAVAGDEAFDLIVSNPPYIPLTERDTLHAQVRDHEPHVALFGGEDGHDVFRRLIPQAAQQLRPGGWLLLETAGRTALLDSMLAVWDGVHAVPDLQGIERIVAARKPLQ